MMTEQAIFWRANDFSDMELLKAKFLTHVYPRHTHEGYVIGIIERGAEMFYYQNEIHVASAGNIVFINPGEVHTGEAASDAGWSYRTLYPDIHLLQRAAADLGQSGFPVFPTPVVRDNELAQAVRQLHLTLEHSSLALERESVLFTTFARLLLRHANYQTEFPRIHREHNAVKMVQDYMQANFAENISLETLANLVHFSPFYLSRVFQKTIGLPPHSYLMQLRISQAKRLLLKGVPIKDAAVETGFVDQSHFTRHFKRFVGVTPGQYRKHHH